MLFLLHNLLIDGIIYGFGFGTVMLRAPKKIAHVLWNEDRTHDGTRHTFATIQPVHRRQALSGAYFVAVVWPLSLCGYLVFKICRGIGWVARALAHSRVFPWMRNLVFSDLAHAREIEKQALALEAKAVEAKQWAELAKGEGNLDLEQLNLEWVEQHTKDAAALRDSLILDKEAVDIRPPEPVFEPPTRWTPPPLPVHTKKVFDMSDQIGELELALALLSVDAENEKFLRACKAHPMTVREYTDWLTMWLEEDSQHHTRYRGLTFNDDRTYWTATRNTDIVIPTSSVENAITLLVPTTVKVFVPTGPERPGDMPSVLGYECGHTVLLGYSGTRNSRPDVPMFAWTNRPHDLYSFADVMPPVRKAQ